MKFAEYDQNGNVVTFYIPDVHNNIPENVVEITDEEWQLYLSNQNKYKIDVDLKILRLFTEEELAEIQAIKEAEPKPVIPKSPTEIALETQSELISILGQQLTDLDLINIELGQQNTSLELDNIELGQLNTDLELRILQLEGINNG